MIKRKQPGILDTMVEVGQNRFPEEVEVPEGLVHTEATAVQAVQATHLTFQVLTNTMAAEEAVAEPKEVSAAVVVVQT